MGFYADLHIHSKYSRATGKDADLEHMAYWARRKGITVLGTGDFTHPVWLRELETKLVPAEPGLFRLRPDLEAQIEQWPGAAVAGHPTRFLLEVEVSTIYKAGDRTRKVHHCLYAPDLESARRIVASLARIGNLASDGRPILGLDSRDLLEITLEAGSDCHLIPAHIWTPWFAALGSKSGFDSIEECYRDLAGAIFAVETGLSSDPHMNRRLSRLDRFTLISSSDAHSPQKIGREAAGFHCELSYHALFHALKTGESYGGTLEFFAEEGKYHLDGHRECGVRFTPEESRDHGGLCPVCGKALTLGVLHRVSELADRSESEAAPLRGEFRSLIPLAEVLSELEGSGPQSKAVQTDYERLLRRIGPEIDVLEKAPPEDLRKDGSSLLAEAIERMRRGQVRREGGFDGQYGTIRIFEDGELDRKRQGGQLLELPGLAPCSKPRTAPGSHTARAAEPSPTRRRSAPRRKEDETSPEPVSGPAPAATGLRASLDPDQRSALDTVSGTLVILAGPGAGKTRTLTHRLAYLVQDCAVEPEACLAITFTRRAARELRERLEGLLPGLGHRVAVHTFHGLGHEILIEHGALVGLGLPLRVVEEPGEAELSRGLVTHDDLIELPLRLLTEHPETLGKLRRRFCHVAVDEFQDLDARQYALLRTLVPPGANLCVIGDPDQSIYGFRGSDPTLTGRLQAEDPNTRTIALTKNYRSSRAIVEASRQVIAPATLVADRASAPQGSGPEHVEIHQLPSDRAEAAFVVHAIEQRLGGTSFLALDSRRADGGERPSCSLGDFAVLYRTNAQAHAFAEALAHAGLPFQERNHKPWTERPEVRGCIQNLGEGNPLTDALPLDERLRRAAEEVRSVLPGVDTYLPFLLELAQASAGDLQRFLSEVAIACDVDFLDPRAERISLLTLHAAKGLEFPVVFLTGLEDGIVPLRFGSRIEVDLAEERRLLFVGMTRARRELILTRARQRSWRGQLRAQSPSPFLADIEEKLLLQTDHGRERPPPKEPRFQQLTLF